MKELVGGIVFTLMGLIFIIWHKYFAIKAVNFWNKMPDWLIKLTTLGLKRTPYTSKVFSLPYLIAGILFLIFGLQLLYKYFK